MFLFLIPEMKDLLFNQSFNVPDQLIQDFEAAILRYEPRSQLVIKIAAHSKHFFSISQAILRLLNPLRLLIFQKGHEQLSFIPRDIASVASVVSYSHVV